MLCVLDVSLFRVHISGAYSAVHISFLFSIFLVSRSSCVVVRGGLPSFNVLSRARTGIVAEQKFTGIRYALGIQVTNTRTGTCSGYILHAVPLKKYCRYTPSPL